MTTMRVTVVAMRTEDEREKWEAKTRIEKRQEVASRIEFLKKVIEFARLIIDKLGTIQDGSRGQGYVCKIRKFYNFNGFSFLLQGPESRLGGNCLKVWHHPHRNYTKGMTPILDAWWQLDIEQSAFDRFDSSREWRQELLKCIHLEKKREYLEAKAARRAVDSLGKPLSQQEIDRRARAEIRKNWWSHARS